jgi:hypothetical protein
VQGKTEKRWEGEILGIENRTEEIAKIENGAGEI